MQVSPACSCMFPPRGPSRSQPVAWRCRFVLVSRWGSECPQPGLGLGRAVPCALPWWGLCGCPEAEPCLSTAGSLPLWSQIKPQGSARCQLQSGPFPLFYCHQILQVAISGISAKGGFDPISFSIAYCFCAWCCCSHTSLFLKDFGLFIVYLHMFFFLSFALSSLFLSPIIWKVCKRVGKCVLLLFSFSQIPILMLLP